MGTYYLGLEITYLRVLSWWLEEITYLGDQANLFWGSAFKDGGSPHLDCLRSIFVGGVAAPALIVALVGRISQSVPLAMLAVFVTAIGARICVWHILYVGLVDLHISMVVHELDRIKRFFTYFWEYFPDLGYLGLIWVQVSGWVA